MPTKAGNVRLVIQEADKMGMLLELTLENGTELFGYWIEEYGDEYFTVGCGNGQDEETATVRYDEVAEIYAI